MDNLRKDRVVQGSLDAQQSLNTLSIQTDSGVTQTLKSGFQSASIQEDGPKNPMELRAEHLGFSYDGKRDIFSDLSFSMHSGQLLCLLGPNGCGKTTLLNCLAGLLKYDKGDAFLDDCSLEKMSPVQRARALGYVPQTITATFDYSVLDYVVTGCAPYLKLFNRPKDEEYERAFDVLRKMDIEHLAYDSYARISGGERQLVSIARVLVQRPSFILLDEPTAHLDYGNQIRLLSLVKKMTKDNYGVLMTTHNPDHVLMLDAQVVMMQRGGAYQTGLAQDIFTEESLHQLYGIDVMLEHSQKAHRDFCIAKGL